MLGALLAFISAAFYGTNNACLRRGVLSGTVSQAMAITVPLGVPLFLTAAFISGQLFDFEQLPVRSFYLFAAAGILHFVWGRYWNYRSTVALGSIGAGPIQQSQLLISIVLAVVFLHETLSPLKVIGILLILLGPTLIAITNKKKKKSNKPRYNASQDSTVGEAAHKHFEPKILVGYMCALLSATGYGVSPVLIRAGLAGTDLGLAGGLIAYIAAAVTFGLVTLVTPGQLNHIKKMDHSGIPWYLLSGVLVFFAQMLRFLALGLAPVTVVSPIQRLSMVARVVAGYFINRQHEMLNRKVLAGVALSLLGSALLALAEAGY